MAPILSTFGGGSVRGFNGGGSVSAGSYPWEDVFPYFWGGGGGGQF